MIWEINFSLLFFIRGRNLLYSGGDNMKRFKIHITLKGTLTMDILYYWYFETQNKFLKDLLIVNGRSLKEAIEKPIGAKEEMNVVEFVVWGEIKEGYENFIEKHAYYTIDHLTTEGLEVISKTSCYYSIEGYGRPHNYIRLTPEGD